MNEEMFSQLMVSTTTLKAKLCSCLPRCLSNELPFCYDVCPSNGRKDFRPWLFKRDLSEDRSTPVRRVKRKS